MPAKKRFIILIAAAVLCLLAAGALAVGIGFFMLRGAISDSGLRVYKADQVASSHPGYRRSTLTAGDDVYVNDYEEAALQLVNPVPTTVIALKGNVGYSKVCAIPSQSATAYVAADDGSEMPAYVVYRHKGQPPFDWRSAKFREMTFVAPGAKNSGIESSDPALLAEVLALLRDVTPVRLPGLPMADAASIPTIRMASDQLPGLLFCPVLRTGPDGTVFLAESLMFDLTTNAAVFDAKWIPASPKLMQWLQSQNPR
jgi:hypothetical protein